VACADGHLLRAPARQEQKDPANQVLGVPLLRELGPGLADAAGVQGSSGVLLRKAAAAAKERIKALRDSVRSIMHAAVRACCAGKGLIVLVKSKKTWILLPGLLASGHASLRGWRPTWTTNWSAASRGYGRPSGKRHCFAHLPCCFGALPSPFKGWDDAAVASWLAACLTRARRGCATVSKFACAQPQGGPAVHAAGNRQERERADSAACAGHDGCRRLRGGVYLSDSNPDGVLRAVHLRGEHGLGRAHQCQCSMVLPRVAEPLHGGCKRRARRQRLPPLLRQPDPARALLHALRQPHVRVPLPDPSRGARPYRDLPPRHALLHSQRVRPAPRPLPLLRRSLRAPARAAQDQARCAQRLSPRQVHADAGAHEAGGVRRGLVHQPPLRCGRDPLLRRRARPPRLPAGARGPSWRARAAPPQRAQRAQRAQR